MELLEVMARAIAKADGFEDWDSIGPWHQEANMRAAAALPDVRGRGDRPDLPADHSLCDLPCDLPAEAHDG